MKVRKASALGSTQGLHTEEWHYKGFRYEGFIKAAARSVGGAWQHLTITVTLAESDSRTEVQQW